MRLERLADDREKLGEKIEDLLKMAEDEKRDLADVEQQQLTKYRERYGELEERDRRAGFGHRAERELRQRVQAGAGQTSRTTARAARTTPSRARPATPSVYRNFAQFARDQIIVRFPVIAERAAGSDGNVRATVEQAKERLERAPVNTLSSNIPGLIPPRHICGDHGHHHRCPGRSSSRHGRSTSTEVS